jgi:hypothetical protein
MKRRSARAKIIAVLLETMAILHSETRRELCRVNITYCRFKNSLIFTTLG